MIMMTTLEKQKMAIGEGKRTGVRFLAAASLMWLTLFGSTDAFADFLSVDEKELVEEFATTFEVEAKAITEAANAATSAGKSVEQVAQTVDDGIKIMSFILAFFALAALAVIGELDAIRRALKRSEHRVAGS